MANFFPSVLRMRIFCPTLLTNSYDGIVSLSFSSPTIIPLVQNYGDLPFWVNHSYVVFSVSCILAQSTKSWWHCIITFHFTIPYASCLHHRNSINSPVHFNPEQECRTSFASSCKSSKLLCPIRWHIFVSHTLIGSVMPIATLVSSSLLILDP
jgi:hypothetical protein